MSELWGSIMGYFFGSRECRKSEESTIEQRKSTEFHPDVISNTFSDRLHQEVDAFLVEENKSHHEECVGGDLFSFLSSSTFNQPSLKAQDDQEYHEFKKLVQAAGIDDLVRERLDEEKGEEEFCDVPDGESPMTSVEENSSSEPDDFVDAEDNTPIRDESTVGEGSFFPELLSDESSFDKSLQKEECIDEGAGAEEMENDVHSLLTFLSMPGLADLGLEHEKPEVVPKVATAISTTELERRNFEEMMEMESDEELITTQEGKKMISSGLVKATEKKTEDKGCQTTSQSEVDTTKMQSETPSIFEAVATPSGILRETEKCILMRLVNGKYLPVHNDNKSTFGLLFMSRNTLGSSSTSNNCHVEFPIFSVNSPVINTLPKRTERAEYEKLMDVNHHSRLVYNPESKPIENATSNGYPLFPYSQIYQDVRHFNWQMSPIKSSTAAPRKSSPGHISRARPAIPSKTVSCDKGFVVNNLPANSVASKDNTSWGAHSHLQLGLDGAKETGQTAVDNALGKKSSSRSILKASGPSSIPTSTVVLPGNNSKVSPRGVRKRSNFSPENGPIPKKKNAMPNFETSLPSPSKTCLNSWNARQLREKKPDISYKC